MVKKTRHDFTDRLHRSMRAVVETLLSISEIVGSMRSVDRLASIRRVLALPRDSLHVANRPRATRSSVSSPSNTGLHGRPIIRIPPPAHPGRSGDRGRRHRRSRNVFLPVNDNATDASPWRFA